MKRAATVIIAFGLALTGCSAAAQEPASTEMVQQQDFLARHNLAGMAAADVIDHLDRVPTVLRPTDLTASVEPRRLVLADAREKVLLPLPENLSYISIAPYIQHTHECVHHSPTTCLGELNNADIRVTFTDGETGETLLQQQTTTFDNGFAGFWIPSDITGSIEVTHRGLRGETTFSTAADGATCITDLQLV